MRRLPDQCPSTLFRVKSTPATMTPCRNQARLALRLHCPQLRGYKAGRTSFWMQSYGGQASIDAKEIA